MKASRQSKVRRLFPLDETHTPAHGTITHAQIIIEQGECFVVQVGTQGCAADRLLQGEADVAQRESFHAFKPAFGDRIRYAAGEDLARNIGKLLLSDLAAFGGGGCAYMKATEGAVSSLECKTGWQRAQSYNPHCYARYRSGEKLPRVGILSFNNFLWGFHETSFFSCSLHCTKETLNKC